MIINTYIYITVYSYIKKLLWVALTQKSLHRLHLPPKKSLLRMSSQKVASPTKKWHLWTSGHLTPFDHLPQWFHIFQPLNSTLFDSSNPDGKGHRVSCLCQVSWVQCVSWCPNDCIWEFFFRFSMEKLIGVGSCCLRLQDEGGGGWGGKTLSLDTYIASDIINSCDVCCLKKNVVEYVYLDIFINIFSTCACACVYVCTYIYIYINVVVSGSSLRALGSSSHVVEADSDHSLCLDDGYPRPDEPG